jgi:hypothetical protein
MMIEGLHRAARRERPEDEAAGITREDLAAEEYEQGEEP